MLDILVIIASIYGTGVVVGFFYDMVEEQASLIEAMTTGVLWFFWLGRNIYRETLKRIKG